MAEEKQQDIMEEKVVSEEDTEETCSKEADAEQTTETAEEQRQEEDGKETSEGAGADVSEPEAEEDAREGETDADEPKKDGFFKKKKKDKKDEQIEELNDRLKRQMAEFDNFRKRTEKEKSQMFDMGARTIIEKILPVVDNFERGLAAVPKEQKEDAFVSGMDKVYRQMMTELENIGVKAIEAVGEEFNPEFHNAVMQMESEEYESGVVAQELQKGYLYKDTVVRHSMVAVVQ